MALLGQTHILLKLWKKFFGITKKMLKQFNNAEKVMKFRELVEDINVVKN